MSKITEKMIISTFIDLLNQYPLDKITVKDIVEKSQISRNTFYYHFADVPELLAYVLNLETKKIMQLEDVNNATDLESAFIRATEFASQNKKAVYHVYMSSNKSVIDRYFQQSADTVVRHYIYGIAKHTSAKNEDVELLITFYKSALFGLIINWVASGMNGESPEDVHRLATLLEGNIYNSLTKTIQ